MRDYTSGTWGFSLVWGLKASVFPWAIAIAAPNAILAFVFGTLADNISDEQQDTVQQGLSLWGAFTSVLFFILYFRSNVAYSRWWEGGTLLQQTRGEWFNAYSSLIAFSSTSPDKEESVEAFHHMLARFMSLLFAAALQQVSPDPNRPFEIIDPDGIDPTSLEFLNHAPDKVEVILQWIQRTTILNMSTGVLPIPPPVMSRAFQEISRGIVNLQNARKIADFPFPYPYAQTSVVMLIIHWCYTPFIASLVFQNRWLGAVTSFMVIFFLWCINYIALQLENPFGDRDNDLPMVQMQSDWNKSIATLLARRAQQPPKFEFDPPQHRTLPLANSDGSELGATARKRLSVGITRPSVTNVGKFERQDSRGSAAGKSEQKDSKASSPKVSVGSAETPISAVPAAKMDDDVKVVNLPTCKEVEEHTPPSSTCGAEPAHDAATAENDKIGPAVPNGNQVARSVADATSAGAVPNGSTMHGNGIRVEAGAPNGKPASSLGVKIAALAPEVEDAAGEPALSNGISGTPASAGDPAPLGGISIGWYAPNREPPDKESFDMEPPGAGELGDGNPTDSSLTPPVASAGVQAAGRPPGDKEGGDPAADGPVQQRKPGNVDASTSAGARVRIF